MFEYKDASVMKKQSSRMFLQNIHNNLQDLQSITIQKTTNHMVQVQVWG
jgi:hypothetical protein